MLSDISGCFLGGAILWEPMMTYRSGDPKVWKLGFLDSRGVGQVGGNRAKQGPV